MDAGLMTVSTIVVAINASLLCVKNNPNDRAKEETKPETKK